MVIKRTDMKFTDQIERELMQRSATQVPGDGFGNPSGTFTGGGPWFTAAVLAIVTMLWVLATP